LIKEKLFSFFFQTSTTGGQRWKSRIHNNALARPSQGMRGNYSCSSRREKNKTHYFNDSALGRSLPWIWTKKEVQTWNELGTLVDGTAVEGSRATPHRLSLPFLNLSISYLQTQTIPHRTTLTTWNKIVSTILAVYWVKLNDGMRELVLPLRVACKSVSGHGRIQVSLENTLPLVGR
jgi:hypothetical protein